MRFCFALFFPKIVFRISGEIFLQSPALEESGRLYLPALRHPWEPLGSIGPPAPPQHTTGSTPSLQGGSPAASSWSVVRAPNSRGWRKSGSPACRRAGLGVAAGRTWASRQVGRGAGRPGPPPSHGVGRSGRRGAGTAGTVGGGRVLGAWRAANVAIALGPPRLSARDEPHLEKGLLQAGRQQDRLGAAQDLRVPDARRQRGLRRRVVRPPGMCAGAGGGRGGGAWGIGVDLRWAPRHRDAGGASGRAGAQPMPGPASGVASPAGTRGCAPTTLMEDPKAQSPAGLEELRGAFPGQRPGARRRQRAGKRRQAGQ